MSRTLESEIVRLYHRGEGVFTGTGVAYRNPRVFPQDEGRK